MAATMAHAMLGRADQALAALGLLEGAIERMEATRWVPRPRNLRAWIASNLGEPGQADELNNEAVELSRRQGLAEPLAHGLLDLAAGRLMAEDPDGATRLLDEARLLEDEEHAFRWRHQLRRRLLQARHDLMTSDLESATAGAVALASDAGALGSPRHEVQARLLAALAQQRAGVVCDQDDVERLLLRLEGLAGLESWWLTAEVAECFGVPRWAELARRRVVALRASAGAYGDTLARAAAKRLG
jgi:hypothetical protein